MHRDTAPGEPLHVRHRRIVICFRMVRWFFFENAEHTARRGMAFRARAYSRSADQNPVAIHMHRLLRNTHEHDYWSAGGQLRGPPVIAWFKGSSWFAGGCALGVKRWLLHCLR